MFGTLAVTEPTTFNRGSSSHKVLSNLSLRASENYHNYLKKHGLTLLYNHHKDSYRVVKAETVTIPTA